MMIVVALLSFAAAPDASEGLVCLIDGHSGELVLEVPVQLLACSEIRLVSKRPMVERVLLLAVRGRCLNVDAVKVPAAVRRTASALVSRSLLLP